MPMWGISENIVTFTSIIFKDDQEAEDVFISESNKGNVKVIQEKRKKEKKERKTYKLEISFTLADAE